MVGVEARLDSIIVFSFSKGGGLVAFVVVYGDRRVCIASWGT